LKALKKKAQLKNFQKSKGTQNAKQATRTLQPYGHTRKKLRLVGIGSPSMS